MWTIHRRIGMSGGLMANAVLRETGHAVTAEEAARLRRLHCRGLRPLDAPGATAARRPRAAGLPDQRRACPGRSPPAAGSRVRPTDSGDAGRSVRTCPSSPATRWPTPSPTPICSWQPPSGSACRSPTPWWWATASGTCWPPSRARALGIGLLSGGYGQDELERAGAYRVYQDPADLLKHLDEVGVRA